MSESTTQAFKAKLKNDFPNITVDSISILGKGWYYDAIEVNGSIIFRIPHHTYSQGITPEMVHREIELLKILKNKVPVEIPDPKYIAQDKSYYSYPRLGGVILHDIIGSFNHNDWKQFKTDWVALASAIHRNVGVETARALNIPDFQPPDAKIVEQIVDIPKVDKDIMDFAKRTLKQFRGYRAIPSSYAFIHCDLQSRNILVDQKTKRITGLIDWTDARVGPLSREFSIHEWMPGELSNEAATLYEEKTGTHIDITQARMWYSLDELGAYVYAVKAGEADEASESLYRLKRLAAAKQ